VARSYRTQDGRVRTLYYVRFTDWQGKRRVFPGGDTLALALKRRDFYLGKNAIETDFDAAKQAARTPPPQIVTLSEWGQRWLATKQHKRSVEKDRLSLSRLCDFFGDIPLSQVSSAGIAEYQQHRRTAITRYGTPPTAATINRELAFLRSLLILAERDHVIAERPHLQLDRETGTRTRLVSESEYQRLCEALPAIAAAVLTVLWELGAREGEVLALRWSHVNCEEHWLRFIGTKGSDARRVPMSHAVHAAVCSQPKGGEESLVFPLTRHQFLWYVRKARHSLGLHTVHVHDLRRTFITRQLNAGVNYKVVMAITGHKSLHVVTRHYNQPSFDTLREVIERKGEKTLKKQKL